MIVRTSLAVDEGQRIADEKGPLELDTDVVVVGSGAGGAVVAATLAESGQRVLVLEEGSYLSAAELGQLRPSQTMRRGWREAGMSFAMGVGDSPMINVHMGRCVGGSSVMTGGVCFRTPDEVLDEWATEHGLPDLGPARMGPYFEAVEQDLHVETVPTAMRSRSTALFGQGAERLGFRLEPNRRNTDGCCGCSRCNFGCPHQAKLSVDLTYLPRAVAAGARILSDCLAQRVLMRGEQAVGIEGRLLDRNGKPRRRFKVTARRVVIAAGAWHTPRLLMDSDLADGLPALGRGLTLHPSFRVMARFDEAVEGWRGVLQSAHSTAFSHERITMMSVFVPLGVLVATLPGIGLEHARHAELAPHLAMFGGMVHDDAGGRVLPRSSLLGLLGRLGGREPTVTYALSRRDRTAISRLLRQLGETYLAAGAREIFLPILGGIAPLGLRAGPFGGLDADGMRSLDLDSIPARQFECASQHPLGSCKMGVSKENAVVDADGKVFGVRELFLADSSVLPSSLGVNPQISVMAMAMRTARRLRDRKLPE